VTNQTDYFFECETDNGINNMPSCFILSSYSAPPFSQVSVTHYCLAIKEKADSRRRDATISLRCYLRYYFLSLSLFAVYFLCLHVSTVLFIVVINLNAFFSLSLKTLVEVVGFMKDDGQPSWSTAVKLEQRRDVSMVVGV
jgi:hypothetical protein